MIKQNSSKLIATFSRQTKSSESYTVESQQFSLMFSDAVFEGHLS